MTVISAEGISKKFRLSQSRGSLKDHLFRRGGTGSHHDFWALHEFSLTVNEGEAVGIIGHNGSGKSTTLKCIAGILKPTTGLVRVKGRVASLLELGAGFHPDLSGRDNVFINAAFLGIPRQEIARRFDDIVGFAELGEFIDQQVKYYSSGMFVRLGFAVAVNVDPDLLLIDEVLAVGDEAFQQKCLEKIEDFQREGRTLLFVTHAAELVRRICNRGIVLDHGHMVADAEPGEAIRVFRSYLHSPDPSADTADHLATADFPVQLTEMTISSTDGEVRSVIHPGEPLRLEIDYRCDEPVSEALLHIEIRNGRGETLYSATSDALGAPLPDLSGEGRLFMEFASIPLLDGRYPITVQIRHHHDGRVLGMRENLDAFEVTHLGKIEGTVLLPARLTFGDRAGA